MSTVAIVIVVLASAWIGFSAYGVLARRAFVVDNLRQYRVPERWWVRLGLLKALGALGLLVGLVVPAVGVAAAVGLVLYFVGAILTVCRARAYTHLPFPILYLVPAAIAGVLLASA
ncbi:DoxX family protein [Mumia sp. DW29H23]|uniref:DoxX family protein n=1 Tax=Mumia sp. DW29H23 TaxID=3421241 RepID=UPI003D6850F9